MEFTKEDLKLLISALDTFEGELSFDWTNEQKMRVDLLKRRLRAAAVMATTEDPPAHRRMAYHETTNPPLELERPEEG